MFTQKELQIIKEATRDRNYLNTDEAQRAWNEGAEDALEQSKE